MRLLNSEGNCPQNKKSTYWMGRNIFKPHYSIRDSYPKYTRNFYNSGQKKKNPSQLKNGQTTWTDIFPKRIHKRPTGAWKGAEHHKLRGQCMSKLQWDILSYLLCCLLLNRQKITCWWRYREKETFVYFWWGRKLVRALWETKWSLLRKLKM